MSDNNGKFIIGDNTDGYRRSTTDYDLDLFSDRKKSEPKDPAPAPESKAQQGKAPRKQAQRKSSFFGKKPSAPIPEKKGPSVKRYANPPKAQKPKRPARPEGAQGNGQKRPLRPQKQQKPQKQVLSVNEEKRLHAEKRKEQRRRKQILQYVAIAAAVVAVVVILSLTVFFRIDEIKIIGKSPYSDEQIIASSGIAMDENIIMCDAGGVSAKLPKALPYIGSAEVERSLSGLVTITVNATTGRYSFINGELAVIVDANGKVLEEAPAEKAADYTVVTGAEVSKSVPGESLELSDAGRYEMLKSLCSKLDAAGIKSVTAIDITDVYKVSVVYEGRLTLELGNTGSIDRKLALAAKVIERENEIDPAQYGIIDLGSVEGKAFFRPVKEPEEPETETEGETGDLPEGETLPEDETNPEGETEPEEETTQAQTKPAAQ